MKEKPYRTIYPNKEKISKNPITKRTYNKIRDCFKWHYIETNFNVPMCPREEEFLQWIKKFLNSMETALLNSKGSNKGDKSITLIQALGNCCKYMEAGGFETDLFTLSTALAIVFDISKEDAMDKLVAFRRSKKK